MATPSGARPWSGVVVIHDVLGMSHDLKRQADCLAREGYLVVAPDLFSWGRRMTCVRAVFRDAIARQGRTFDDIEAVSAWLDAVTDTILSNRRGTRTIRQPRRHT